MRISRIRLSDEIEAEYPGGGAAQEALNRAWALLCQSVKSGKQGRAER